jgi:SAM-dependent methyltransferase
MRADAGKSTPFDNLRKAQSVGARVSRVAARQGADATLVREYYDTYWSAPEQPRYELSGVLTDLLERNIDARTRCLDVGCGAGQTYAQWVNQRAGEYAGVDVSASAVEIARDSGLGAEVIEDAGALPFEDESFDVAICIEVLEHLFSPDKATAEICRVLRPGGILIASTPNAAYWRLRANLVFGLWNPLGDALSIEQPWRDPHIRFFTPHTMSRMLSSSGFSQVDAKAHGGCFFDHLTSRPTNFGVSPIYRRAEQRFPSLLGMTIHAVAAR